MHKNAIKKFAIEARKKLIASVSDKAGMFGITEDDFQKNPITRGTDFAIYRTVAGTEVTLNRQQCHQRELLVQQMESRGYEAVIEEVAYTWFNRICAIRFMEVNDYLPARVRVLSSEKEGKSEPDLVTQAPDVDLDFTDKEREWIIEAKMNNKLDDLFKMLFIKQCNKLHEILPELFEATEDYTEMLFHVSYTNQDDVIQMLIGKDGVPEEDFNIQVSGQVEIIGWLYQYYNEERKNEVINIYKGTVKKEDIPAATQLFTTDWIVRYMVDNSLGRHWIEKNPQSKLGEKLEFFVMPKSGEISYVDEKIEPMEITFLDPCMGSGHVLVYAFDVLMEIYRECGYSDRDAALHIVQHNLFGIDLDKRAYQLAYFAVMMKARSYNRRALTQRIEHNLCEIWESNGIYQFVCEGVTFDREQNEVGQYLIDCFKDAKELGSLISVESEDYTAFTEYLLHLNPEGQVNIFQNDWNTSVQPLCLHLAKQAGVLSNKYHVVATNPPYLGKMQGELKKFVTEKYKDYSGDLFAVFMYRNFDFCVKNGYSAFMTPFVWMFIKTYEKLREYIIENKSITTLVQMEYSAFEEATVPICSFVLQNNKTEEKSLCVRLSDFKGGMETQKQKVLEALGDDGCSYFYEAEQDNFSNIPGGPIAYWLSDDFFNIFNNKKLGDETTITNGLFTCNNKKFLRLWFEVDRNNLRLMCQSKEMCYGYMEKWYPYNKGGDFRRWYGNQEYIVNFKDFGREISDYRVQNGQSATFPGQNCYFLESVSWSLVSSSKFGVRYYPKGFVFDIAGSSIFSSSTEKLKYILGFLSSSVAFACLTAVNPTINFQVGNIRDLPFVIDKNKENTVVILVDENILISKNDWDSFEISWDFKKHPLVALAKKSTYKSNGISSYRIEDAFFWWDNECNTRFAQLKANEEELNRIFIDIYGLQEELIPEVEYKDITVRKVDLGRDIRSFISYAVGCMFGRYSIYKEGICYAGGKWNRNDFEFYANQYFDEETYPKELYQSEWFMPDDDNIIPITDEEYFPDDIVTRFVEFVKTVYGEDTLEENLNFISNALNGKGATSREVIRNYFLKDFYADHLKMYQKRPIYWLFDSGKQNGFKALIYMHRYDADTVGRVRTDYLHRAQNYVETAMKSAQYTIDNSTSASEKSKATKAVTKYTKQLAEMQSYDEAIAHVANQCLEIDLDDGVKVNYVKFQDVEVAQEGKKALKVNLLAKI